MSTDLLLTIVVILFALCVFSLLLLGGVLVVRDTIRQSGRWGLNFKQAYCLKCGTPMPVVRKPASLKQALWGGGTCAECGFELDKWGRPVAEQPFPAKWSAQLDEARPLDATNDDERYKSSPEEYHRGDFRA